MVVVAVAAALVDAVALAAASIVVGISATLGNSAVQMELQLFSFPCDLLLFNEKMLRVGLVGLVWTNCFRRCTRLLGHWHLVPDGNVFGTCPVALYVQLWGRRPSSFIKIFQQRHVKLSDMFMKHLRHIVTC